MADMKKELRNIRSLRKSIDKILKENKMLSQMEREYLEDMRDYWKNAEEKMKDYV